MNQDLNRLYQRICDYSPDDRESAFTFTQRLARDNGWNMKYAERVVAEYKRFMFLAVAAGHPVTPSDQVDQAWHLHLIYTRSYWDDLCGQVLGMPIHHGPTKGGGDEQETFRNLYERTKESYRQLLNESPPSDIWPDAERRFGDDIQCVRVNTRQHWIVSRQRAKRYAAATSAAVFLVAIAATMILETGSTRSGGPPIPQFDELVRPVMRNTQDDIVTNIHANYGTQPRPTAFARQNSLILWGLAIGTVAASCFGFASLFRGKCSACGRAQALKKTGRSRRGTGWWASTQDEWKCTQCGATAWTTHFTACGSGGGTASGCGGTTNCNGGDAGCANSGCAGTGCGGGGCGGGGCGGGGCGGS